MIVPFNLAKCPDQWVPADGKNGTPDLQGYFVRGYLPTAGTVDALGKQQPDQLKEHSHHLPLSNIANLKISNVGSDELLAPVNNANPQSSSNIVSGGVVESNTASSETRPPHVSLLYCVKQ
jgi:hypothetical protein